MSTTTGKLEVPFTEMVLNTIEVHGLRWACEYYFSRLPAWQARFFIRAALKI